jgi:hypothetical protein
MDAQDKALVLQKIDVLLELMDFGVYDELLEQERLLKEIRDLVVRTWI